MIANTPLNFANHVAVIHQLIIKYYTKTVLEFLKQAALNRITQIYQIESTQRNSFGFGEFYLKRK
jgi:hypothetical protein